MNPTVVNKATRTAMMMVMCLLGLIAVIGIVSACRGTGPGSDGAAHAEDGVDKIGPAAEHYVRCIAVRIPGAADGNPRVRILSKKVEEWINAGDLTRPEMSKILYSLACPGLPREFWWTQDDLPAR